MFQYAAGRYYARLCNAAMSMATDPPRNANSHGDPRPFLLSHFAITSPFRELSPFERALLLTQHRMIRPALGSVFQHISRVQVVTESMEQRFQFQPFLSVRPGTKTIFLMGYWQVHNIPDSISTELRQEFSFLDEPTGANLDMLEAIRQAENPVSIHIRRGDYTLDIEGNVALKMDYYSRAIEHMRQRMANPTFFVFSDDIGFARSNLALGRNAVFADQNDSFSAHEDLRLMAACRHHIIANSTFSWWGAWLNPSSEKVVVAPSSWMVGNHAHYPDLFPPNWQLMN